mgnify:CR=1 FL=1
MSGGGILTVIGICLLILNYLAITLYFKENMPLWGSGLIISFLGPVIGFISGSVFVEIDHSMGEDGTGGALGGAFVGLVILGNGIIYIIIGMLIGIKNYIERKKVYQ